MNFQKILEEALESTWNPRQYPAASKAPSKDFVRFSKSDSYAYPYQNGGDAVYPPSTPEPPKPVTYPWPLDNINELLGQSFVSLMDALKNIKICIKNNPTLSKEEKKKLYQLYKHGAIALRNIKDVGVNVSKVVDIGVISSPQIPPPVSQKQETKPEKSKK
jgi:hypothetical protein